MALCEAEHETSQMYLSLLLILYGILLALSEWVSGLRVRLSLVSLLHYIRKEAVSGAAYVASDW